MDFGEFTDGIYAIDFEFRPSQGREGNLPDPVCLVVIGITQESINRYFGDELRLMSSAPFPISQKALLVTWFGSAEMDCMQSLNWALPLNHLDLYAEFRCLTNQHHELQKNSLIDALIYYQLPTIGHEHKEEMRSLILNGGGNTPEERESILDYCESDVVATVALFNKMRPILDLPRALHRGRYMKAVSRMQYTGIPVDLPLLDLLRSQWTIIQDQLIQEIDQEFNAFDGRTFKVDKWAHYLQKNDIAWPRLDSGRLDLKDDTFKAMARIYPAVDRMRNLRRSLSETRVHDLYVGDDGRNRCLLSPFKSKTGRNQPSTNKFIFGLPSWLRALIKPKQGWGLAYVDWSQQEFGIAAALSGDEVMKEAYHSGDPYLAFAKQSGAVPADATKHTHKAERDQFKACVLAVQYGMGEDSLALRINQPVAKARYLLRLHNQTYSIFWKWSDSAVNEAVLNGQLWAGFGWFMHTVGHVNERSLRNFPMQANGAEILRLACIYITEAGIRVCAPVHDALLIEAPLEVLDHHIATVQALMAKASRDVLKGFELRSEADVIRYPNRYLTDKGRQMWVRVMEMLGHPDQSDLRQPDVSPCGS